MAVQFRDASPKERSLFFRWLVGGTPVSERLLSEGASVRCSTELKKPLEIRSEHDYLINPDMVELDVVARVRTGRKKAPR